MDELLGYTLFAKKIIVGTINKGNKSKDFNGCDFGTTVVFSDNTGVVCLGYYYYYSYWPSALLFAKGTLMKMCVEGELYDIGPLN